MNEHNLIPNSKRTPSELREQCSNAGRKSGEVRRRKKSMKQKLQLLLSLPACDNDLGELKILGIDVEDSDNEMVILKGLFLKAAVGDVAAVKEIRNILGKDNSSAELELKKRELKLKEQSKDTSSTVLEKLDEVLGGIESDF